MATQPPVRASRHPGIERDLTHFVPPPRHACVLMIALVALLLATAAAASVAPPFAPPRWLGMATDGAPAVGDRALASPLHAAYSAFPDVQVNVDPGDLVDESGPAIAVSPDGVIHVVWNGDESQKSVWYSHSTDGGLTFSLAVRINDAVAYPPSFSVYQPDIAVDRDGAIDIVWFDYRAWTSDFDFGARIDCYFDRSTDGGTTWGTDVLASGGGSGTYPWHFQPCLAADPRNGDLYVSFTDYDRYLPDGDPSDVSVVRSIDGGATFAPKVRADGLPDSVHVAQGFASIAVAPTGDVVVAFEDARGTSRDIRLAHSSDGAGSFDSDVLVNSDTTGVQQQPTVVADWHGNLHVAWLDWSADADPSTAPFLDDIRYARAPAGGTAFGAAVRVTDVAMNADAAFDWPPRLAVDRLGHVHVTWFDRRSDTTFCYVDRSTNDGASFGADQVLTSDRSNVSHALPRIALLGDDDPCMTWMDRRNPGGLFDVFFTRRLDVAAVGDPDTPIGTRLASLPNPSAGATQVRFALASAGRARLEVRDLAGRLVRTLADQSLSAGLHTVSWDGADAQGRRVPAGAYWIRLDAGATHDVRKAVRLR